MRHGTYHWGFRGMYHGKNAHRGVAHKRSWLLTMARPIVYPTQYRSDIIPCSVSRGTLLGTSHIACIPRCITPRISLGICTVADTEGKIVRTMMHPLPRPRVTVMEWPMVNLLHMANVQ